MVKYRTLDGTFGALSHPARRKMMMRLQEGEASVGELAAPHKMSLPAISRHVRVLEEAGLVLRRNEGRQSYLSLATSPLQEVDSWLRRFRADGSMATDKSKTNTPQREEKHG